MSFWMLEYRLPQCPVKAEQSRWRLSDGFCLVVAAICGTFAAPFGQLCTCLPSWACASWVASLKSFSAKKERTEYLSGLC